MLVKLWAILVSIYIYSPSVAWLACFCLFVSSSYLRQGISIHTAVSMCHHYIWFWRAFFGVPGMPYLPISHINSTQNGSPVVENPLVTVQIGTFYFALMTNIEMIATLRFQMGLLERGLHCLKTLAWHLRFPY